MEEFKGNSNASKKIEERRVTEPVTSDVKVKSANLGSKFFAQDIKTTAKGVTNDIMIPGVKNLIVNILKKAVDYLFLGSYTPNNTIGGYGYTNYTSFGVPKNITYSGGFNAPNNMQRSPVINQTKSSIYAVNEITFHERGDAEEVLMRMLEIIQRYGMVSVLDFYDLINQKCNPSDNRYGWKDLSAANVTRTVDGYKIIFPRVIALED